MTEQQPVAVLGGGSFGTAIANLLAENGQQVYQWMRDPIQAEAMRNQRENPRYLKGIKLRVPEGKWRVKMFQAYGANPSPMKFSEVFTALQTGVMDGQENP